MTDREIKALQVGDWLLFRMSPENHFRTADFIPEKCYQIIDVKLEQLYRSQATPYDNVVEYNGMKASLRLRGYWPSHEMVRHREFDIQIFKDYGNAWIRVTPEEARLAGLLFD